MSTERQWHVGGDLIIPHPTRAQILVQQNAEQWRLPTIPFAEERGDLLRRIQAELQWHFGLDTWVVRQLFEQNEEAQHSVYYTFLLEHDNLDWQPPALLRWLDIPAFAQVQLAYPEQREVIECCLQEIASGLIPQQRARWEQPGWVRTVDAWIRQQLQQLGTPATGPLEQVKQWCLSAILRIPTTEGWVYCKAANGSKLMVNEAVLTQRLAQLFPATMPQPLALEPTRDWLLLADFGAEIGWGAAIETREAALIAFAELQIASAAQVNELLTAGCIDRRLSKLAAEIVPLVNDPLALALLTPEQQQRVLKLAPRLTELCEQMATYHVPATLVHGDLHMSNIARRGTGFVFFDWSDACVAHPFLDMIAILHEKDIALQTRLRDAYLAAWTPYESPARLLALWQLAYPICALHQAVSYRYIAQHVEGGYHHPMTCWATPFWFGKILETEP